MFVRCVDALLCDGEVTDTYPRDLRLDLEEPALQSMRSCAEIALVDVKDKGIRRAWTTEEEESKDDYCETIEDLLRRETPAPHATSKTEQRTASSTSIMRISDGETSMPKLAKITVCGRSVRNHASDQNSTSEYATSSDGWLRFSRRARGHDHEYAIQFLSSVHSQMPTCLSCGMCLRWGACLPKAAIGSFSNFSSRVSLPTNLTLTPER